MITTEPRPRQFSIRAPIWLVESIETIARKEGRSRADVILILTEEALEARVRTEKGGRK